MALLVFIALVMPIKAQASEKRTVLPNTSGPVLWCVLPETIMTVKEREAEDEWFRINREREEKLEKENAERMNARLALEANQRVEELDLKTQIERAKQEAIDKIQREAAQALEAAELAQKEAERKKLSTSVLTITGSLSTRALAEAMTQIGKPYVWGAVGPDTYDCSGLVLWAYNKQGYFDMPRTTRGQWLVGERIEQEDIQRGDLIYYLMNKKNKKSFVDHVGIYIGDGMMLHAPRPGAFVEIKEVFWSNIVIIRRHK